MITALVAFGPNNVQQICMLFDNLNQGLEYITKHLSEKEHIEIIPTHRFGREGLCIKPTDGFAEILESGDEKDAEIAAFWTSYYGGCGFVVDFFLTEFPTATPLLIWDLD